MIVFNKHQVIEGNFEQSAVETVYSVNSTSEIQ